MPRAALYLTVIAALGILSGCAPTSSTRARTIIVFGTGSVTVPPDGYVLRISVSHTDMDVETARKAASVTSGQIVETLKRFPTDPARTRTTNLSVEPNHEWVNNHYEFRGYEASQDFRVYLTDLEKAEECVLAVLKTRPERASGEFISSEEKSLWPKARERALLNAELKASQMAAVLGQQLGRPVSIKSLDEDTSGAIFGGSGSGENDAADSYAPQTFEDRLNWIPPTYVTVESAVRVEFELAE